MDSESGRPGVKAIGVSVLLVTGVAGLIDPTFMIGGSALAITMKIGLALLLFAAAIALTRFISRHADEIGEARFDTRNPEDRED
jgi:hypothetical protein